jgi:hypothetical protein
MSALLLELPKIFTTAKDNKNGRKVRFGAYYFPHKKSPCEHILHKDLLF